MRRGSSAVVALTALLTLPTIGPAEAGDEGATVRTDRGVVRGTVADDHRTFQGIPFAAPPDGYWTRFAAHGNPNGPGLPAWRPVRRAQATPYVQSLESGPGLPGPVDLSARHQCGFWQTVP